MADFTGPTRSMPGTGHALPSGATCDAHPDRPAVARMQGETDSMGAELIDCCAECRDQVRAALRSGHAGRCEWCKRDAPDLKDRRSDDEGSCGPVYQVCGDCRRRSDERLERELRAWGD